MVRILLSHDIFLFKVLETKKGKAILLQEGITKQNIITMVCENKIKKLQCLPWHWYFKAEKSNSRVKCFKSKRLNDFVSKGLSGWGIPMRSWETISLKRNCLGFSKGWAHLTLEFLRSSCPVLSWTYLILFVPQPSFTASR